jgi:hypothetical protein
LFKKLQNQLYLAVFHFRHHFTENRKPTFRYNFLNKAVELFKKSLEVTPRYFDKNSAESRGRLNNRLLITDNFYLRAVTNKTPILTSTEAILTHSPALIFLVSGFSGTTICDPGTTVGLDLKNNKTLCDTDAFPLG